MLEWRLEAYRRWLTMREPHWARVDYGPIDYQDLYYYSAPKRNVLQSLDEVDPEILRTYEKLGIPLREQKILAGVVGNAPDCRSARAASDQDVAGMPRGRNRRSRKSSAPTEADASRSMRCSTRSRSRPPSRRSSPHGRGAVHADL
jgi:Fe-S cluster assembly scaffold protein SufB